MRYRMLLCIENSMCIIVYLYLKGTQTYPRIFFFKKKKKLPCPHISMGLFSFPYGYFFLDFEHHNGTNII